MFIAISVAIYVLYSIYEFIFPREITRNKTQLKKEALDKKEADRAAILRENYKRAEKMLEDGKAEVKRKYGL